jgi:hypothetical protein
LLDLLCRPEGLGVEIAERSDSKFYDKGNVRSKQLLCFLIEPEGRLFSFNIELRP